MRTSFRRCNRMPPHDSRRCYRRNVTARWEFAWETVIRLDPSVCVRDVEDRLAVVGNLTRVQQFGNDVCLCELPQVIAGRWVCHNEPLLNLGHSDDRYFEESVDYCCEANAAP